MTDPEHPELLRFLDGPPNTMTLQVQVADRTMITDGFIEVFDAADRELGLDAIKQVFAQACNESPLNMFAALRRAAAAHGVQLDDQSALIVRVIAV